jgi:uncharacterized protein YceK
MKKILFVFAVIVFMAMSACSSIRSVPGGALVYSEPVLASETATFIGSGLKYATARAEAVKEAADKGYKRILAEYLELNSITGFVDVTLVMTR